MQHMLRQLPRQTARYYHTERGRENRKRGATWKRTLYLFCLPPLNPSRAGALPGSFGRADVNSLTGLGSKCLIRSGEKWFIKHIWAYKITLSGLCLLWLPRWSSLFKPSTTYPHLKIQLSVLAWAFRLDKNNPLKHSTSRSDVTSPEGSREQQHLVGGKAQWGVCHWRSSGAVQF